MSIEKVIKATKCENITKIILTIGIKGHIIVTRATEGRKSMDVMTDREKQILKTFALLIPRLSDSDKSYLIGLGEGMAIKSRQNREKHRKDSAGKLAV